MFKLPWKKKPHEMDIEELTKALNKKLLRFHRRELKSEIVYGRYAPNPVVTEISQALRALEEGDTCPALQCLS